MNTFCQILELTVGGGGLFKKGLWCEIKAKTGAEGFLGTTFLLLQEGIGHEYKALNFPSWRPSMRGSPKYIN